MRADHASIPPKTFTAILPSAATGEDASVIVSVTNIATGSSIIILAILPQLVAGPACDSPSIVLTRKEPAGSCVKLAGVDWYIPAAGVSATSTH